MQSAIKTILKWAKQEPQKTIVIDSRRHWTWGELIHRGYQYYQAIQASTEKHVPVAIPILIDRTGETIAAIIGTLMSNKGFAPLSIAQPRERIKRCLDALEAKFVLATEPSKNNVLSDIIRQINAESNAGNLSGSFQLDPPSNSLLYVLFTSGSTGFPKGVCVSHANLHNTIQWSRDILDWNGSDVVGCATNFNFDLSTFDLFTCLLLNIPLAIYTNSSDPNAILDETYSFKVTSILSVPVFFSQFVKFDLANETRLASLRRILSGGDFFPPAHILRWYRSLSHVDIYNLWGPTETTIVNTMHKITDRDVSNLESGHFPAVGRWHKRMPFVLLDENDQQVKEPFTQGEICMLGDCVTDGYLKDKALTNKYYGKINGLPAFRTRDIGYIDNDGDLYILGRIDNIVKISGYRIHLGEVESAATQIPEIHLACGCVIQQSEGIKELWLAVEPVDKNQPIDIFTVKQHLRKMLPHYMVPKRIIPLESLPRNNNRKIDRLKTAERLIL